jgi:hypothetical protein
MSGRRKREERRSKREEARRKREKYPLFPL